ncbi:hypothetical protein [Candidatus Bodocaedibacter vickermanii]|uniref:Uncharacterized protein n=1 Tax=Candidatus Bodocaedibacter vickermanii TaxID=2741701 RepID=A0A7L9RSG2_9PROT|nr:hypothetical protein CPBP_00276 [Candidatus Paracaedibacteraceae bacterium 'Lake Konstanz']
MPIQLTVRHDNLHLFTTLGITVDPTYEAMNAYAQAHWLRKPGQERWHMNPSMHQAKANQIIASLKLLGMIDRIDPSIPTPDYAMILGATVYRMRTRMQHMIELIDAGTFTPRQIVVLTGDRPLDPVQEPESLLLDKAFIRSDWQCPESLPTNESEAAKFVWGQLQKSDRVNRISIVFLPTSMLEKNGKIVRPATEDSLKTWLKLLPLPGSIVAFSNQPFAPYQNETMKPTLIKAGWFKHKGTLETVGLAFTPKDDDEHVARLLDNLARYMYSILHVKKALAAAK